MIDDLVHYGCSNSPVCPRETIYVISGAGLHGILVSLCIGKYLMYVIIFRWHNLLIFTGDCSLYVPCGEFFTT